MGTIIDFPNKSPKKIWVVIPHYKKVKRGELSHRQERFAFVYLDGEYSLYACNHNDIFETEDAALKELTKRGG